MACILPTQNGRPLKPLVEMKPSTNIGLKRIPLLQAYFEACLDVADIVSDSEDRDDDAPEESWDQLSVSLSESEPPASSLHVEMVEQDTLRRDLMSCVQCSLDIEADTCQIRWGLDTMHPDCCASYAHSKAQTRDMITEMEKVVVIARPELVTILVKVIEHLRAWQPAGNGEGTQCGDEEPDVAATASQETLIWGQSPC